MNCTRPKETNINYMKNNLKKIYIKKNILILISTRFVLSSNLIKYSLNKISLDTNNKRNHINFQILRLVDRYIINPYDVIKEEGTEKRNPLKKG